MNTEATAKGMPVQFIEFSIPNCPLQKRISTVPVHLAVKKSPFIMHESRAVSGTHMRYCLACKRHIILPMSKDTTRQELKQQSMGGYDPSRGMNVLEETRSLATDKHTLPLPNITTPPRVDPKKSDNSPSKTSLTTDTSSTQPTPLCTYFSQKNKNEESPKGAKTAQEPKSQQPTVKRLDSRNNLQADKSETNEQNSRALVPSSEERFTLLVPTTRSIILLANLMVAAAKQDFKLTSTEPLAVVKYPNSFQATIVQTTNRGYDAFNEAQKIMTQLVSLSERAVTLASSALEVIESGEPSDIQDLLPINLDEITDVTTKCANMTAVVVEKYNDLLRLTREVLRSAVEANWETFRLLRDTAEEMQAVRNQWVYLAQFFKQIADLIKDSLSKTIKDFIRIVESEKADSLANSNIKLIDDATSDKEMEDEENKEAVEDAEMDEGDTNTEPNEGDEEEEQDLQIVKHESENVKREKNSLSKDIEQISEVAKKIKETAIIYSDISQRYLIKCILSLNDLAAMNPAKDSVPMASLQREIIQDCAKADKAISERKI